MTTNVMNSHQRVLLVIAHQDDDVFIISRIRQHIEKQDEVYVIWTAISTPFGDSYAKERVAEAENAMRFLGVAKDNYYFLKHPDGQTYKDMSSIISEIKIIIKLIYPDVIYIPAFEIGHIDHDVAHYSVVKSLGELGYKPILVEFPLYNAYNTSSLFPFVMRKLPPEPVTECRILANEEFQYVSRYWDFYKSQHFPFGWYISLIPGNFRTLGIEYLRESPLYDYHKTPFDAVPAYERFLKNVTFRDFSDAVLENQDKEH